MGSNEKISLAEQEDEDIGDNQYVDYNFDDKAEDSSDNQDDNYNDEVSSDAETNICKGNEELVEGTGQDSPFVYFTRDFPLEIFTLMADNTNVYSVFKTDKSVNTTDNEMRRLVALHIIMGIINYPRLRLYGTPQTKFNLARNTGICRNRNSLESLVCHECEQR
ncbi:hypothetical protein ILUMI_12904 [Ignelater luminosus]|uniref:PiggyBac transposable element-derived protein domain-containing protein n=1 Tax=Ignelater luminosus TaxID=2038154 RepID=A0A8K0CVI5_IGNLU|nr:hypothetical protein ILUMI_12904 [Ignelater luminosus]